MAALRRPRAPLAFRIDPAIPRFAPRMMNPSTPNRTLSVLRTALAILGFGGALIFGAAFAMSYARPAWVEALAKDVVQAEVEKRVRAQVAEAADGTLAGIAADALQRNETQVEAARRMLADSLRAKVARVAAEMRDPDCACRQGVATHIGNGNWRGAVLSAANERMTALIRAKYLDVAAGLTREFRIFTAVNALVLLMLGIAVVVRRNAGLHLLPPAVILACAAVAVGYVYLFRQDWLHTIVFGEYVGLAYVAWLGVAFALLADVALNRARVMVRLVNGCINVAGGTASAVPC